VNRQLLEQPFDQSLVKSRRGPFGQSLSYVEIQSYIQRLNEAFDGQWSFEIVSHEVHSSEVVVKGRLSTSSITKVAFGGSSITTARDTGEVISIADDLKAAASDCLKRAARLLGLGLHLYNDTPVPVPRPNGNNGNGAHRGNGNGSHGTRPPQRKCGDRATQRQVTAIWSMGRSLGQSAEQLRERALSVYGAQPEQLSKAQASTFITELGEALSGGNGS
jgi:hypothetical protein